MRDGIPQIHYVGIEVPMVEYVAPAYVPQYIHPLERLSHEQGLALRQLRDALEQQGARLNNGKPVNTRHRAVMWALERIGEKAP